MIKGGGEQHGHLNAAELTIKVHLTVELEACLGVLHAWLTTTLLALSAPDRYV